jgi:exopolyphosphatase/guanosine-5'-triphosphate,3'-diphosphate pyrophosphatase
MAAPERFAAIDVGSNSIRCLIAERGDDGHLHVIDDLKDQPRLARGLSATGRLSQEAMDGAVDALARMTQAAERRGVTRIALVATSAVRDAANGAEFVERVKQEIGIPLEVIDGETEARLAFLSVREHFAIVRGRAVVADIGGGSLELVLAVGGLVEHVVSFPFGAVRATEQFFAGGSDAAGVRRLRAAVRQRLRRALPAREWSGARFFGSGGTFTNAARVMFARESGEVPPGGVHGAAVNQGEMHRILEWFSGLSVDERRKVAGLNPERADIIVAGLAVATEAMAHFNAPSVTVSAFGLREGLLLHLADQGADKAPKDVSRGKALRRFADRCRTDRRHVEQVLRLSRILYDHLGKRLGCEEGDWPLLEAASLLHDVGQLVSYKGHHKHSYHLIQHAESLPLSPRERQLVATISRYHRKRPPTKRHPEFAALAPEDRRRVRRLAGLLRVADGLDRGHVAAVETIKLRLTATKFSVEVAPRLATTDLKLELWGAARKSDLLEKLLGVPVELKAAAVEAPGPARKRVAAKKK